MLFKEIVDARTHARTDDGRRTLKDHKSSLEHFVLRWAKKACFFQKYLIFHDFSNLYEPCWAGTIQSRYIISTLLIQKSANTYRYSHHALPIQIMVTAAKNNDNRIILKYNFTLSFHTIKQKTWAYRVWSQLCWTNTLWINLWYTLHRWSFRFSASIFVGFTV